MFKSIFSLVRMQFLLRVTIVSLALMVSLSAGPQEEYPGDSLKWRRYESPNFELLSDNRERDSRQLLYTLEQLRALILEQLKVKERQPLAITIYYFADKNVFQKYVMAAHRANDGIIGFYVGGPDRASIVIPPTWNDVSSRQFIYHQYVHHLMRTSDENPPLWYVEGVAELYASTEFTSKAVEMGHPLVKNLADLSENKVLPLGSVFLARPAVAYYGDGFHSGQFYAETWALLHYWLFGVSDLDREKIGAFLAFLQHDPAAGDSSELLRHFV